MSESTKREGGVRDNTSPVTAARSRKAAIGSFVGAVVDWYDFLLYGFMAAVVFNSQFFPSHDPTLGTLAAFATLGVGFLFRPLGGVIFGHYGDIVGRRSMLVITVGLMGVSSAAIGLLPTYASIGWYAPLLLVILRILQGAAVGGEWGGAALMAVESAPAGKKAFYSSGVQVGFGVALIIVTGIMSGLSALMSNAAFMSWGWRLPFVFSIVLVAIALWIRLSMDESPEFVAKVGAHGERHIKAPVLVALRTHPGAFFIIISMRAIELLAMYMVTTFSLFYSTTVLHMSRELFLNIGFLVGAVSCVTLPLFAWLADKIGYKRVYLTGAVIGLLATYPFFIAMEARSVVWIVILSVLLANIAHDMVNSVQQPLFTNFFGTEYRYSGANVAYQVASVVFGGFTPFVATLLFGINHSWQPVAAYMALGCLLSLVVAAAIKMRHD
jgi:MHS family shikimate/dehydroshikimate transporter-like MFS transporter